MASSRCAVCGNVIVGPAKKLNGQCVCTKCYNQGIEAIQRQEAERRELVDYILELFHLSELPPDWDFIISQLLTRDKKTIFGIKATLYYYYEIEGHPTDSDYGLNIVRYQYESAQKFFMDQQKLRAENEKVDLGVSDRTILISAPTNETRIPKYNIEDL